MEIVGYALLVGVGLLLGVMGGGGSILSVPILVYLFSLDIVAASSYSLFIVGTTSAVGTALKRQDRFVDIPATIELGIPSLLAAFCTRKWIVCTLPDILFMFDTTPITKRAFLLTIFATVLVLSSVMVIHGTNIGNHESFARRNRLALILAGFCVGLLCGLAGAGGGFLILPALMLFGRLPFNLAVGSALPIIATNSLAGFLGSASSHPVNWYFLASISILAVVGIFIGNHIASRFSPYVLKRIFGWLSLILGVWILLKEWMQGF